MNGQTNFKFIFSLSGLKSQDKVEVGYEFITNENFAPSPKGNFS